MPKKSSGLGRGLEALIPKKPAETIVVTEEITNTVTQASTLPIQKLRPNPKQPRQIFEEVALQELANSIQEKGLLQPILVRPKESYYEIVAGERRWRASQRAGLSEVPVIVRELADRETLEIALIENLQREDLNPLEEARSYEQLLGFGITQDELAKAVGKGRSTIANTMRLLALPLAAQKALEQNQISAGHARAILAIPETDRDWALGQILANELNVRQAEALKRDMEEMQQGKNIKTSTQMRPHKQVEADLSRQLSTKVRIYGETSGKMEISFHGIEDLNRLLELLGYQV